MSDDADYEVGYGRPPKHTQFKRGKSPNPAGRPAKQKRALLPSQTRKDVLEVMDELVEIKTAAGRKKITKSQLIIRTIANNAAKGSPTALRQWLKLSEAALDERFRTYASVRLIEMLMQIVDDPAREAGQLEKDSLSDLLRKTKRLY